MSIRVEITANSADELAGILSRLGAHLAPKSTLKPVANPVPSAHNVAAMVDVQPMDEGDEIEASDASTMPAYENDEEAGVAPAARGRGRPKGSKNKTSATFEEQAPATPPAKPTAEILKEAIALSHELFNRGHDVQKKVLALRERFKVQKFVDIKPEDVNAFSEALAAIDEDSKPKD